MSYTNIIGADELLAKIESLQPAREQAVKMCGLLVEKEAKRLCPVDDGTLRNSIQASEVESWYGDRGLTFRCEVGTNVEYAPYVHQGTGIYAKEGDGRDTRWSYQDAEGVWHSTLGQKPNPFLKRALRTGDGKGFLRERVQEAVHDAIKYGYYQNEIDWDAD